MEIASSRDVLAFWFSSAQSARWYAKDDDFDAEIQRRFLATYEAARSGKLALLIHPNYRNERRM
jgi:uncharacterized protein (DUF924 family)